jgi:hypothetical protein
MLGIGICHFDEPFGSPFAALRASAQDKLREEKSALPRAKDFSLPLEMTSSRFFRNFLRPVRFGY